MRQGRSSNPSSPISASGFAPRITVLAVAAGLLLAASATGRELAPRQPLPKMTVKAVALPPGTLKLLGKGPNYRLIVKFRDEVLARAANGSLISLAAADLAGVENVAAAFDMSFSTLINLPEQQLEQLEERAASRSWVAQPDLAGMLKVEVPGAGPAELQAAGETLQLLPEVEFAYIQTLGVPPPHDVPPFTPDYVPMQTYFGPDPGMDADYAWSLGFKGEGIRLSDCEYGWKDQHEDLHDRDLNLEPGVIIDDDVPESFYEHGTAVLGMTSGVVNLFPGSYGVNGMVPEAEVYTYPEYIEPDLWRRVEAITNAIAGSGAGDVVLLEMQTGAGGPAEVDPAVWTVVQVGTDAGVIVVGAAGNGNQNLDGAAYADYRALGDSGAIIVGAGSSDTDHDKLGFSTFGSRVDVQGWGESVFTLGYGHFIELGGDPNQRYTHIFGGTSSASPFVAAAAVALQEAAELPVAPRDLRDLLIRTGIAQGTGGHIGPFVNLRTALDELLANNPPVATDDWTGTLYETPVTISFATLLENDTDPDPNTTLRVCGLEDPKYGTIESDSESVTYIPLAGCFGGYFSFEYTLCDNLDGVDTGTVWIQVGGIVCPPPSK